MARGIMADWCAIGLSVVQPNRVEPLPDSVGAS